MKRLLASLMAAVLLVSTVMTGVIAVNAVVTENEASKYVTLDGDWHYKLYRTYSRMFQYFPYGMVSVTSEDKDNAIVPATETWQSWPVKQMPANDTATGGLLTNEFSPTWSEAWVVRSFDLPADFTTEETVTLLMGIIDDNDVVYINGQLVAASGFLDGNGQPTLNIPATGGFNYSAAEKENQVKWEKSYWEIQREYTIPASVLKQGETNEIAVRLYNNNSNGGFYSGQNYALCGNTSAVRFLKGLPSQKVEQPEVMATVAEQIAAIQAGDMAAYAATISDNYHNDQFQKADVVADMTALVGENKNATVTDESAAVYMDDEGLFWYNAKRTIVAADETVLFDGEVEQCFAVAAGSALERGNWNRCYGTSYDSELFNQELTYSVYLPPSYYTNDHETYPVVWLLHGQNSSSTSYRDVDNIGAFMDSQIASGAIVEMILILPDSGKNAFYRDSAIPADGNINEGGPWRTQLTKELRGLVEDTYRVIPDAEFNGLTGNSMGAYGSLCAGSTNPDLYSSIGLHMGYLPTDAQENLKALPLDKLANYDFYMDCGLQDQTVGYSGTVAVHNYLNSVNKEHGFNLRDGAHNSAFYMSGMAASMKMHSDHFLANGLTDRCGATKFVDIPVDAWYHKAVDCALLSGLMAGVSDDSFAPDTTLSRAMLVQILWAKAGKPACDKAVSFVDVQDGDWYAEAVRWAVARGICSGYSDTLFGAEDSVTREQTAAILYQYARKLGTVEGMVALNFADADQVSKYAVPAVKWAVANGIMAGKPGNLLDPVAGSTRAEAAQMLVNFQNIVK